MRPSSPAPGRPPTAGAPLRRHSPAALLAVPASRGEAPADPFDIDLTIVTEIGADLLPKACGTGDGCASTCASSCASAV